MMTELRLLATRESLDTVNAFIEEHMEACACPMRIQMQLLVAVEEIYVNIASYAYEPDKGDAVIGFDYNADTRTITMVFRDWGVAFNPLMREDPDITLSAEERGIGGLGIYMVKKSMDAFTYERTNGQNVVTIQKKI